MRVTLVVPIWSHIPLLDDVPVRQRYRRIPPSEYEAVKTQINQLLEAQVIRESSSPYASLIVLVRKKDDMHHAEDVWRPAVSVSSFVFG